MLIAVIVGVCLILLCAVSCGVWKLRAKYELVEGKFRVKETYTKKKEEK